MSGSGAKPLPISVCMIAGAEAARIGRALESVKGWTGEIIVVINQEVNDGTEQIARSLGAKIFREPWKGHIGQKNSAAEKATFPWILGLDADEVVSELLRAEIQRLFELPAHRDRVAAYSFPRLSYYCGRWIRHGEWYPNRQVRLWKKGQARWGGEDPHDELLVDGPVGRLRGDLEHYSHDSINHHVRKIITYSDEFVRQRKNAAVGAGIFSLCVRPCWRFFRGYILRLGFLDGWQGFYIARHVAFSTLVRYAKLRESREPNASIGKPQTPMNREQVSANEHK